MSNWELITLGDCANINMGQSPDSVSYNDKGIGMPFLQGCADFGKKHPLTTTYTTSPNKTSVASAILISVRAPVGDLNIADKDYCIGRGLSSIIGKYGTATTDYLYYFLQYTKEVLKKSGQGSTFEAVNSKDLRNHKINLPPLPAQQKIAKILSTIDGQIEKTEAIIAKYQAVKQGMLQDLFTRGIDVATGELRPKYEDVPELYKDSLLGMIPKEWEVVRFGDEIELVHGYQFRDFDFVDSGIPVVKIGQVKPDGLDLSNCTFIAKDRLEEFKDILIVNQDVLMALTGATLGKSCFVQGMNNVMFQNYRVGKFVSRSPGGYNQGFMFLLLNLPLLLNQIFNKVNTGAQGNIGKADFENCKIFRPGIEEQMKIWEFANSVNTTISSNKTTLAKAKILKQGLMSDLLRGKVEVTA